MAERLDPNHESIEPPESLSSPEAAAEAKRHLEDLASQAEAQAGTQAEQLQAARAEVAATAQDTAEIKKQVDTTMAPGELPVAKKRAYQQTLHSLQSRLPRRAARFSHLIHRPAVDKLSEAAAKTIMRPSLALGVSMGMLIGSGLFFYLARRQGFALRGSEFLVAGIIGGFFGLLIEGLIRLFKRSGEAKPKP